MNMKNIMKKWWHLAPAAHICCTIGAAAVLLHLVLRHDHALMVTLSENIVRPIHRFLAVLCSHFSFSMAEVLIGVFSVAVILYIIFQIIELILKKEKLKRLYRTAVSLLAAFLLVYGGLCILWGTYYYGDNFSQKSGIADEPVSVEELTEVTQYFAGVLNEYGAKVSRDENGVYNADRQSILDRSDKIYEATEEILPCLSGPDIKAKGVHFSKIMSYIDFTGFFFPFTAEANVNTDFPQSLLPATIAHELSHQRGVAKEQEANFTAVLVCMNSGDADYIYSGAMLAYVYLGNALYKADQEAWSEVYHSLDDNVITDLRYKNAYWAQFKTEVKTVSNAVYESFLQSYDQKLGLQSYGACVDMLVGYYKTK